MALLIANLLVLAVLCGIFYLFVRGVLLVMRSVSGQSWAARALHRAAPGLRPTQTLGAPTGRSVLFVDEPRGRVAIVQRRGGCAVFSFSQIVSAELVEDGHATTHASGASQLSRAAVGGLLFGRAGAVVGALTGATTARRKVSSVVVRVTVDDFRQPVHCVEFLRAPVERDHPFYKDAIRAANQWAGTLQVAQRRGAGAACGGRA